jgi:uncharacterized protein (DUF488 family)
LLQSYQIQLLADVRTFPGSRRYPHFNKEHMEKGLPEASITYHHMKELGGKRKPMLNSHNTAWRNAGFRGYADYMETPAFHAAIKELEELALKQKVAYMCSEATWWNCHRSMISDYLKAHGWTVWHIMYLKHAKEHPYTQPAKVVQGDLFYGT